MKSFILKRNSLYFNRGNIGWSVSDTFFENVHAVNKRTSIEQVIDKAADAKNIPRVIVTVKNGETSWAYASGEGNIERNHKVDADSAFRIGSTTKTFVATVVLQLAGEKKLSLDDTVEKWLP